MLRALSRRLFRDAPLIRSVKTSTGIVGLPVDPNARENLTKNLHKIKELMSQLVPETAFYRRAVVEDIDEKLKVLDENDNDEKVEEIFGFQLEEVISMTEDELKLIPVLAGESATHAIRQDWMILLYVEHKPWDVPADHEVNARTRHAVSRTVFSRRSAISVTIRMRRDSGKGLQVQHRRTAAQIPPPNNG